MHTATVPPRSWPGILLVLTALAGAETPSVTAEGEAGPSPPAASATDAPIADEPAPDSPAGEPVPPPLSQPLISGNQYQSGLLYHPQPNIRHATPRYEAAFAVLPADAALLRGLDGPLPPEGLRLADNATVLDLQDWLSQQAKVPARIDWRAMEDMGLDAETPLPTNHAEAGLLRAALHELLDDIDLTVIVKHGAVTVTTKEVASENLMIGFYPLPTQVDAGNVQSLIDLIHSTIAADTWDIVGGPATIRAAEKANALTISQTQAVHAELLAFMRTGFDAELATDGDREAGQIPIRVHRIRDATVAVELEARLVALCNDALGPAGDPAAKVSRIGGDRFVVQSASRPFQVYAAQLVRALDGVIVPASSPAGNSFPVPIGMGQPPDGNPFCWVAREVYGPTNPRWLAFRGWMLGDAPTWLRAWYGTHGQGLAAWLHDRPLAKSALRTLMDAASSRR